jgi:hypothetical protein
MSRCERLPTMTFMMRNHRRSTTGGSNRLFGLCHTAGLNQHHSISIAVGVVRTIRLCARAISGRFGSFSRGTAGHVPVDPSGVIRGWTEPHEAICKRREQGQE